MPSRPFSFYQIGVCHWIWYSFETVCIMVFQLLPNSSIRSHLSVMDVLITHVRNMIKILDPFVLYRHPKCFRLHRRCHTTVYFQFALFQTEFQVSELFTKIWMYSNNILMERLGIVRGRTRYTTKVLNDIFIQYLFPLTAPKIRWWFFLRNKTNKS